MPDNLHDNLIPLDFGFDSFIHYWKPVSQHIQSSQIAHHQVPLLHAGRLYQIFEARSDEEKGQRQVFFHHTVIKYLSQCCINEAHPLCVFSSTCAYKHNCRYINTVHWCIDLLKEKTWPKFGSGHWWQLLWHDFLSGAAFWATVFLAAHRWT